MQQKLGTQYLDVITPHIIYQSKRKVDEDEEEKEEQWKSKWEKKRV